MADKRLSDLYTSEQQSTSNPKASLHSSQLTNRGETDEDLLTRAQDNDYSSHSCQEQTIVFLLAKINALESWCMTLENTLASDTSPLIQQDTSNGGQDPITIFLSNRVKALEVRCKTLENLHASRMSLPAQQDVSVNISSFSAVPTPSLSNNNLNTAPIPDASVLAPGFSNNAINTASNPYVSVPDPTSSNDFDAALNTNAFVPVSVSSNEFATVLDPDSFFLDSTFRNHNLAKASNTDAINLQLMGLAAGYEMSDIVSPENMQSSSIQSLVGQYDAGISQSMVNKTLKNWDEMPAFGISTSSYNTGMHGPPLQQLSLQETLDTSGFGDTAKVMTAVASSNRSHYCRQCMRTFKRAGDLRRHSFLHNPRSSWLSCPKEGCEMRFPRNDKLQDHCKRQGHCA